MSSPCAGKINADEKALHELTRAHMRLVIALAVRFRHYGLSLADLIQEGHIGLLEAAARFEPEREVRFSTYATWWIRAAMQNYVLHNWSIVRGGTSSAQKALFFNLRRIRAKLAQGGDLPAGTEVFSHIAEALGVTRSDVEFMDARLSGPDLSLNAPLGDSDSSAGAERMEMLVDDKPRPDEAVGLALDTDRRTAWLNEALTALSERESAGLSASAVSPRKQRRSRPWAIVSAYPRNASARSRAGPWKNCARRSPNATRKMPRKS